MKMLECRVSNCGRRVSRQEIVSAVQNALPCAWGTNRPEGTRASLAWPTVNREQRDAVLAASDGFGLVDLWEISPIRFEDNGSHVEAIIDALFLADSLLCCAESSAKFATRERTKWRGKLAQMQLIVPSPMLARTGRTQTGRESAHALANTAPRRFLVIEMDTGTIDEQAAILVHLAKRAPLALVVHSGGKSLHGWFFCAGQPEPALKVFMRAAVGLGADRATWTRSQFVRMPDGIRDTGATQAVYFFNPEAVK